MTRNASPSKLTEKYSEVKVSFRSRFWFLCFLFCFVLFCFFSVTQISVNVNAFSVQSRLGNDFDHC